MPTLGKLTSRSLRVGLLMLWVALAAVGCNSQSSTTVPPTVPPTATIPAFPFPAASLTPSPSPTSTTNGTSTGGGATSDPSAKNTQPNQSWQMLYTPFQLTAARGAQENKDLMWLVLLVMAIIGDVAVLPFWLVVRVVEESIHISWAASGLFVILVLLGFGVFADDDDTKGFGCLAAVYAAVLFIAIKAIEALPR